jgi:hypothetical protein
MAAALYPRLFVARTISIVVQKTRDVIHSLNNVYKMTWPFPGLLSSPHNEEETLVNISSALTGPDVPTPIPVVMLVGASGPAAH